MRHEHESDRDNVAQERFQALQSLAGRMGRDEMSRGRKVGGKRYTWCGGNTAEGAGNARAQRARTEPEKESTVRGGNPDRIQGTVGLVLQVKMRSGGMRQSPNANTTMSAVYTHRIAAAGRCAGVAIFSLRKSMTAVTTAKTPNGDSREESQQRRRGAAEAYRWLVSVARRGKARKRSIGDDRMQAYLTSRRLARSPHRARAYTDFWGSRRAYSVSTHNPPHPIRIHITILLPRYLGIPVCARAVFVDTCDMVNGRASCVEARCSTPTLAFFPREKGRGSMGRAGWDSSGMQEWRSVKAPKRYSGFTDFKGIVLNATIAFLTALSGKQISKKLLMDEGLAPPEAVQDLDEAIVIANYRARIDAAIPLLKSWLNTKPNPPPQDPILKIFGALGSRFGASSNLGRLLDQRALIAEIMAETTIDFNVINPRNLDVEKLKPPHTLAELRLAGIHAFVLLPDNDGTLSYEQAKEVERLCIASGTRNTGPPRVRVPVADNEPPDETDGAGGESAQVEEDGRGDELEDEGEDEDDEMEDEDEQHFIDEMITVFGAVPPGGTART
ncbi:hypothetical protein K438DRAFT_1774134 [Mycena galopus ATCC 62051]|nr:hypothetical protein K438DRAFT_1774134 [Mycena galopus ATCC 62051]